MSEKLRRKHNLERFKKLLEVNSDLMKVARQRRLTYEKARDTRKRVQGELEKTYLWLIKRYNTWQILKEVGLEWENTLYPLRRKLIKHGRIKR